MSEPDELHKMCWSILVCLVMTQTGTKLVLGFRARAEEYAPARREFIKTLKT
jgi:hypothetical protein